MTNPDFQFLRTEPVDLKRYLPVFLYLSPEFKALQETLGKEHERQRKVQIDVARQFKAETAPWGMASWERMLGINVDISVDLETRRASVLAKMGKPPTVTPAFLTRMINLFTSVAATQIIEHPESYTIDIYLPDSGTHDFKLIDNAVATYLPAHLGHTYHFRTHLDAAEYAGAVIRMGTQGIQVGMLANDEVLQTTVLWSVDTPLFQVEDDDAIHITELGLEMNPVFAASTTEVTPAASAPVGATDGIFYVSGDGSVKQKVGSPATFTRASTAVLGGRTYQVNEPRFMDNGLLFEPTTTNLAASVLDVTNESLKGWYTQNSTGLLEISSSKTYNHSSAIHITSNNGGRDYFQKYIGIGKTVTFSFMAYVVSGRCYATIEEESNEQGYPFTKSKVLTESGIWRKVVVTRKFTSDTNICYFVYVPAGSEVYIDDIQLESRPYATSFTPTSRDAAERLTVAEWVVDKPQWTCEFDLTINDKQVLEWPVLFARAGWAGNAGGKMFRLETNETQKGLRGGYMSPIWATNATAEAPQYIAVTFENNVASLYINGDLIGSNPDASSSDVLSSIWMGDCITNLFNGCIKNFRFSSTVHTAEKIAADSKLDELPVEEDTVLYMPLKKDLSMYGHYND